ncbi:MAG: hypothetical protein LRY42_00135 [Candidatus Pacebacteria bacterium]|nr:hypothetical protein [Candidatus Paceibacterota bacterium]
MTTHILRLFSFCIIGTLVLLASIAPQQSRAQLVVSDPGATGVLVLDQVQQANQTFTSIYDNLKEFALDALAFNLASMLSQQLTQQIINWANTGFDGNPFYVNDLGLYFQDISRNLI